MVFTKRLREGIRRGRIRCSVRIWTRPHVKAGGRYRMDEGHIVVDSIAPIRLRDITDDLAQESGFSSVKDLLETAKHGGGDNIYLIRFHYLPPGAWDVQRTSWSLPMKPKGAPPPDVARLLKTIPPDVAVLVARVRRLLLATLPKAIETPDQQARVIGYGYGPKYRDTVAVIILSKKGVKLGLVEGAHLSDPDELLAGKGKTHRHIAFTDESEVERPAVKALLRAALAAWKGRAADGAATEAQVVRRTRGA
jgi:hypothetical protein